MADTTYNREISIAADEMIARFGKRAAHVAADWANSAHHRGDVQKYEFWQWVCMDINDRHFVKRSRKPPSH
jgi:hypothetical protein